jgi:hypothetical protein
LGDDIRLIGFGRSKTTLEKMQTHYASNSLYEPKGWSLRDGSPYRDVYAAGVLVFIAFLSRHVFYKIDHYARLRHIAKTYVEDKTSDKHLVKIL